MFGFGSDGYESHPLDELEADMVSFRRGALIAVVILLLATFGVSLLQG
jgi:hypothetical protein